MASDIVCDGASPFPSFRLRYTYRRLSGELYSKRPEYLRNRTFAPRTIQRYHGIVKTPPAIDFPEGGTPAERLDLAFRKVLTVPKSAILKAEERARLQREKKRAEKKPH